jgi:hypothetical protein
MSNSWKIAIAAIFILTGAIWIVPWLTGIGLSEWPAPLVWTLVGGIFIALFVIGRDERQRDREADTWVNDPRKSKFENWMEKRRQPFSPKRGIEFFFYGLIVFSIMVGISALSGELASIAGAVAFILIMSLVAGLFGMFTEKVPL